MKLKTKNDRMAAIVDAWRVIHGNIPFTTKEVSMWAIENGLYPVPSRGCSIVAAEEFEARLESVLRIGAKQIDPPAWTGVKPA